MTSVRSTLLFPEAWTRVRKAHRRLQKTAALELGIDPTVLCGIEKGTRAPFGEDQIALAVERLELSEEEQELLRWAAHHDRLVGHLLAKGASSTELAFISAGLHALRHLQPQQVHGLTSNLRQIAESASLVASLGRTKLTHTEAAMT